MNVIIAFTLILSFSACVTKSKVQKYLHKNPEFATGYCAEAYPIKESTDTTYYIDTARHNKVVNDLLQYADSLLKELAIDGVAAEDTGFIKTTPEDHKLWLEIIKKQLKEDEDKRNNSLTLLGGPTIRVYKEPAKKIDLEKIRKDIERKIREATKPCWDSLPLINKTKENTARVKKLELESLRLSVDNQLLKNDLKAMTSKRNKNMYWLWALLALIAVRTYLKIRFKIKWL